MQAKTKNRLSVLAIVALFTLPVVVAMLMTSGWFDYEPGETKNKGVFISPPIKLSAHSDQQWVESLLDHWTLLYRHPAVCADSCQQKKIEMHKIRLSLGHRAKKVHLLVLSDGHTSADVNSDSLTEEVDISDNIPMQTVFQDLSSQSLGQGYGMYVVAPEGYLMLGFGQDNSPSDIIKDSKLLVKRKE
ncbi:MAG: hypothetical protein L3J52_10185 [Proteobacteria bacterium]|nr:hypothetical protein [Pseudomonadota bacterium]